MADINETRITRVWGRLVELMRSEFRNDPELQNAEMAYALLECAAGVSDDERYRDFLIEAMKEVVADYESAEKSVARAQMAGMSNAVN